MSKSKNCKHKFVGNGIEVECAKCHKEVFDCLTKEEAKKVVKKIFPKWG